MRLSPCWRHISLLLRPGVFPAQSWGSMHQNKAMKALLPGACDRNFQYGYSVNYPRGGETHPQKSAGNSEVRRLGNVWGLRHVHLDLLQVRSLMVCSSTSSWHSVKENRVTIVPNYASKFSGLQQVGSWTPRPGCLSSNPFRDYLYATAVDYGRSSGRKISAIESTGTSSLMDDLVDSDSHEQRKKEENKEKKKKSKEMKKLIKEEVKKELKRFFAEALERQKEDNGEPNVVTSQTGDDEDEDDTEESEDIEQGVVVGVVEEVEKVKTSIKRRVSIYTVGSLQEEFEDDSADDEVDDTDVEEDDTDVEEDEDQVEDLKDLEDVQGLGEVVVDDLKGLEEVALEVVEEVEEVETSVTLEMTQDEVTDDELEDEIDDDEDFWEDDAYPQDPEVGDGEDGGGMVLDDAEWGKTALTLASETLEKSFGSDFSLFGFKLSKDAGLIRVRLDKLTDKYGSPSLDDIEKFSTIYSKVLEEEGLAKRLPDNLALEVSSPGAERVVRVPQDLERFKELPMYVRYTVGGAAEESVKDGIWQVDRVEGDKAVWRLANVRANREIAGKGRPLNKKQKDWRLEVAFSDTQLVRLYLDV